MFALINIDSKGYGKIYKSVMRDRNLPLLAKTIYAYFASFAGGGTTAFPRRTTIRNARSAAAQGRYNFARQRWSSQLSYSIAAAPIVRCLPVRDFFCRCRTVQDKLKLIMK